MVKWHQCVSKQLEQLQLRTLNVVKTQAKQHNVFGVCSHSNVMTHGGWALHVQTSYAHVVDVGCLRLQLHKPVMMPDVIVGTAVLFILVSMLKTALLLQKQLAQCMLPWLIAEPLFLRGWAAFGLSKASQQPRLMAWLKRLTADFSLLLPPLVQLPTPA